MPQPSSSIGRSERSQQRQIFARRNPVFFSPGATISTASSDTILMKNSFITGFSIGLGVMRWEQKRRLAMARCADGEAFSRKSGSSSLPIGKIDPPGARRFEPHHVPPAAALDVQCSWLAAAPLVATVPAI